MDRQQLVTAFDEGYGNQFINKYEHLPLNSRQWRHIISVAMPDSPAPALMTLAEALVPYRGITLRTLRRLIRCGRLPATRVGRSYLVSPADVATVLRPVVRTSGTERTGQCPDEREDAQLRAVGIIPGK